MSLLQEVPGFKLPLIKFLKLFESRYVTTISLSDLYRLKDVCVVTDESTGRMVSLNQELRNTPSPSFSSPQVTNQSLLTHTFIGVRTTTSFNIKLNVY